MVRNYKRTSNRVSWSSESLKMALSDVKEGKMTIRAASIIYQIPRGTIQTGLKLQTDETTNLGRFKRVFFPRDGTRTDTESSPNGNTVHWSVEQ